MSVIFFLENFLCFSGKNFSLGQSVLTATFSKCNSLSSYCFERLNPFPPLTPRAAPYRSLLSPPAPCGQEEIALQNKMNRFSELFQSFTYWTDFKDICTILLQGLSIFRICVVRCVCRTVRYLVVWSQYKCSLEAVQFEISFCCVWVCFRFFCSLLFI